MKIVELIAKVGEDNIRQAIESDDTDALKKLFEEEGVQLSDEQLDYIAGGVLIRPRPKIPKRPKTPTIPTGGGDNTDTDDPTSPNWTGDDGNDLEDYTDPCPGTSC